MNVKTKISCQLIYNLGKKTIVSDSDINFKRTEQKGLKLEEIKNYRKKRFLLSKEKKINKTFIKGDFKKSRVGILVTGRMKSSRLPQKALKKIDKFYSLELCLLNCKKVRDINKVALTTSYLEEDKYIVSEDQIFLYKQKEYKAMPGFSFVKPLKSINDFLSQACFRSFAI